jgi:hypothetical protein
MVDGDPIIVGRLVQATLDGAETQVINNAPFLARNQGGTADTEGVIGESSDAQGVGVRGDSSGAVGTGVRGESSSVYGIGVDGESPGMGVRGSGGGWGVYGAADEGPGISGFSPTFVGVYGQTGSESGNSAGVLGSAPLSTAPGVVGYSTAGEGVRGESWGSWGIIGRSLYGSSRGLRGGVLGMSLSQKDGGPGVWGNSESDVGVFGAGQTGGVTGISGLHGYGVVAVGEIGVYATTFLGDHWAGVFQGDIDVTGNTYVNGNLIVSGAKWAAVPYRDGTHRLLYAMESPEAWFEDFGRARLVRGRAQVRLDPMFAGVVQTGGYHVFLTAEGESNGLYVRRRTRVGFEVWERGGGRSSVGFSYRVVAKRKDIPDRRFEKVRIPRPPAPRLKMPDVLPGGRGKSAAKLGIADLSPLIARAHEGMRRLSSGRWAKRKEARRRAGTTTKVRRIRGSR